MFPSGRNSGRSTADAGVRRVPGARTSGRLLEGEGLSKNFGALLVLDGVDFLVGVGEAVGVVGPNGAGKTTLLSVACRGACAN